MEVTFYDQQKGKGLIATSDIEEGEVIWKEDPFIIAPEWDLFDLQLKSTACAYCTTPLVDSPIAGSPIPCPASISSAFCPARFCNRLCLSRSAKTHPLLCPAQNPASVPLMKWTKDRQWMALHALAQCMSRILLASQKDEATLRADWEVMRGLAALGMEERFNYSFKSTGNAEPDRSSWKKAHQLCVQAFKEPKTVPEKKKLARLLKKPLPADVERELFEYDPCFLRNLGSMSLNLEGHGGLYTLHSHLNHSCRPNASVRHLDQRTALSRITIVAKRPIKKGEELLISYVNPELRYETRQSELQGWGFGSCRCQRCLEEEKQAKEKPEVPVPSGMEDLESELKAGLGVM